VSIFQGVVVGCSCRSLEIMSVYMPRIADQLLREGLNRAGAVVIEGPKSCGKTETARRVVNSELLLDMDNNAEAARLAPGVVLDGKVPRLLDEYQIVPDLWNAVRRKIDDRGADGQFVLTGSAALSEDVNRHSGAGRFSFVRMRPMSMFESGNSTGQVSLDHILNGETGNASASGVSIPDLAEVAVRGGWPLQQKRSVEDAYKASKDYLKQIIEVDVEAVTDVRNPDRLAKLIRAIARNVTTDRAASKLGQEAGGPDSPIDVKTVNAWMEALERIWILEPQPGWGNHLRSNIQAVQRPRRHLVCPSLVTAALDASAPKLIKDLNTFGFIFESLVIRDLRIYSQLSDGIVEHYRDKDGLEVDAIITAGDGRWGAFEVKLGSSTQTLNTAAANLKKFKSKVDTTKIGDPAVLAVITGRGVSYLRDDGVQIISISTLGP